MSSIGVVIPCYNQGRTVRETVESVLGQTRRPTEIVLVNDGSTDLYTRQLLHGAAWPGVSIIGIPNGGLPAARNHGIGLTRAEYLVTLDADDILEPRYLESTSAVLDGDPAIGFVTTAIRGFGEASYVWTPPPCDLISAFTRGAPHPASMFRRRLWQDVGGFDEINPLHGIEDLDFWIAAMERGFQGQVLPEALLRYRVTARSMHQRNVASGAHRRAMSALLSKHRSTLEQLGIELLAAKEAAFLDLWRGQQHLHRRQGELEGRIRELDDRLRAAREALRAAGHEPIEWGDLRRLTPISPVWGVDRGLPLDRHYIQAFLERHRADITGAVLEVKDSGYTRAFGSGVVRSEVVDIHASNPHASIIADLSRADAIPSDSFDCFILTQTLPFIFDTRGVLAHAFRILKPGGVLLCTVPASGRISYEDDGIDGDYWRFTEASVRRLFAEVFPLGRFDLDVWGNILSNVAFLYGLAPDELRREELDHTDPYFPLIITVRAVKPDAEPYHAPGRGAAVPHRANADSAGAILLYHRVPALPDEDQTAVEAHHFRAQMEYLRRECRPMTLEELVSAASCGAIPDRAVAVTVDDGWIDSLEIVSPIASELGIPITFFLDTDRLDQEHERWWEIVPRILLGESGIPESLSIRLHGESRQFGTATGSGRRTAYDALRSALLHAALEERTRLVEQVMGWSGLDLAPRRNRRALMSSEIRQLAAAGHEIGAHTVHHLLLIAQPRDVRIHEILESKRALEALSNRPVKSFAYPYGYHDDECVDLVRAAGFTSAVVVDGRLVAPGSDPFRLSRLEIGNWDCDAFARFLGSHLLETR
jgi:peptidoglycan/xylan/chitin deacetylase (PgdA/CDA1 family)/glycosyltransferase involved in cell wall biosynthesis/SAM-dependent methyltransferase